MIRVHLSKILGEKRISQRELARKIEANPNTIGLYYNEKAKKIRLDDLNGICRELKIKVGDLLEYIPDEAPAPGNEA